MTTITRRAMFAAAPAALVATLPLAGQAATSSAEIDALFDQWVAAVDNFNSVGLINDDVDKALMFNITELERQMCSIPSRTPADLAKKLFASHSGEVLNYHGPGILQLKAEIEALTGQKVEASECA